MKRVYTVWKFASPSTGESKLVAKVVEPNDLLVQHEYQRIVWRGSAATKLDALMCGLAASDKEERESV